MKGGICLEKERSSSAILALLLRYKMVFVLLAMVVFLSLATDVFMTPTNVTNVLRQISINAILALGVTFVILTGGIDLSLGSILAFSGVISTSIVLYGGPDFIILGLLGGILVGAGCGFISGLVVSIFKAPAFVITLAMMTILRGFALMFTDGRPVVGFDSGFLFFGQGFISFVPMPVAIAFIVFIISFFVLEMTKFGRHIYAVGGNPEAAMVSGINVKTVKTLAFTISGACAGLGGVILASRINVGQPAAGAGSELDAIAAVVIGGTSLSGGNGGAVGTVVGALIIGVINNGMNLMEVSSYWQQVIKGVIIALAVIVDIMANRKKFSK